MGEWTEKIRGFGSSYACMGCKCDYWYDRQKSTARCSLRLREIPKHRHTSIVAKVNLGSFDHTDGIRI